MLDHRIVDTRDTFAEGKSIRVIAEEAGLLDFYRQAYSLASGVANSEWWSVETHAMESVPERAPRDAPDPQPLT